MSDLMRLMKAVLEGSWHMLTDTQIPGTTFSVAALLFGLFMVSIGFRLLAFLMGWHFDIGAVNALSSHVNGDFRSGLAPTSPRISAARKNDEF